MAPETYPMPPHGWTCFHCGETFTTIGGARDHFGFDPSADPACRIKLGAERGLLMVLRKLEAENERLTTYIHCESAEGLKAYRALQSRVNEIVRNAEELGYERGLADAPASSSGMTEEQLRILMRRTFKDHPASEWCRLHGVHHSHVSAFLHGQRPPSSGLLRAMNLRIEYIKMAAAEEAAK